jgi:hypothetical protein
VGELYARAMEAVTEATGSNARMEKKMEALREEGGGKLRVATCAREGTAAEKVG